MGHVCERAANSGPECVANREDKMKDRVYVGTRKGLFEIARKKKGAWEIANFHFLGEPVSALLPLDGALYVALDLGHFGAHLWRREGNAWRELAVPAFPPKPRPTTRIPGRSARSGRSSPAT
jgi:hypothetical protein